jgi:tRNA dimethylallyltransferase
MTGASPTFPDVITGLRPRVGFIVGPTGAGKTALAVEVAERLDAEIVNADSRQLYVGADIGTAKPSIRERERAPHHLLDICAIDQPIDVAQFAARARQVIADIVARGRRVLVVGGSGLYLRVLRDGIFAGPAASPELRVRLNAIAEAGGNRGLHAQLTTVDPEAARRISPNDRVRVVRALEVYYLTGASLSRHQQQHRFAKRPYVSLTIGVSPPRQALYSAIDRRFNAMIEAGLIEEVRGLLQAGYDPGAAPLNTIGYREIAEYLRGAMTLVAAVERAKRRSRNLAKRQLTWFRADHEVDWFDPMTGASPVVACFQQFFGGDGQADEQHECGSQSRASG